MNSLKISSALSNLSGIKKNTNTYAKAAKIGNTLVSSPQSDIFVKTSKDVNKLNINSSKTDDIKTFLQKIIKLEGDEQTSRFNRYNMEDIIKLGDTKEKQEVIKKLAVDKRVQAYDIIGIVENLKTPKEAEKLSKTLSDPVYAEKIATLEKMFAPQWNELSGMDKYYTNIYMRAIGKNISAEDIDIPRIENLKKYVDANSKNLALQNVGPNKVDISTIFNVDLIKSMDLLDNDTLKNMLCMNKVPNFKSKMYDIGVFRDKLAEVDYKMLKTNLAKTPKLQDKAYNLDAVMNLHSVLEPEEFSNVLNNANNREHLSKTMYSQILKNLEINDNNAALKRITLNNDKLPEILEFTSTNTIMKKPMKDLIEGLKAKKNPKALYNNFVKELSMKSKQFSFDNNELLKIN